jgi:hypothetical protein
MAAQREVGRGGVIVDVENTGREVNQKPPRIFRGWLPADEHDAHRPSMFLTADSAMGFSGECRPARTRTWSLRSQRRSSSRWSTGMGGIVKRVWVGLAAGGSRQGVAVAGVGDGPTSPKGYAKRSQRRRLMTALRESTSSGAGAGIAGLRAGERHRVRTNLRARLRHLADVLPPHGTNDVGVLAHVAASQRYEAIVIAAIGLTIPLT